jgi:hypothetical protein
MDVSNAWQVRNTASSARDEGSIVAFPSERRLSPRTDRSLGVSPADRRAGLAACKPMHRHSRSARLRACSAGRLSGRPRYSARRAKVGFGGECGNGRAARADGTHAWVWDRRLEHLAHTERDWAAHTTPVETGDAAKGVHRPKDCATKACKRRGINVTAGPCGRSNAESGKRRRGALLPEENRNSRKQVQTGFFVSVGGWFLERRFLLS